MQLQIYQRKKIMFRSYQSLENERREQHEELVLDVIHGNQTASFPWGDWLKQMINKWLLNSYFWLTCFRLEISAEHHLKKRHEPLKLFLAICHRQIDRKIEKSTKDESLIRVCSICNVKIAFILMKFLYHNHISGK